MEDNRFKISWTSLSRWETCRQKDYLYRQKVSTPDQDHRNFLAGTVVDYVQKQWLDDPQGDMVDLVEYWFERSVAEGEERGTIRWRSKNDRREIFKKCQDAATQLQPILTARVLPYDYEPAKRFFTPVRIKKPDGEVVEIILRGEFDLLVKDDSGRFIVWDLKTTTDNDYWKKTLGQLLFYDLAIISMFGAPPIKTGLIQPLCDEQIKEFTFTNEDRAQMWGRISAMMGSEWIGDHSPKVDSAGCSWCEVSRACSKFNMPLVIGKRPVS